MNSKFHGLLLVGASCSALLTGGAAYAQELESPMSAKPSDSVQASDASQTAKANQVNSANQPTSDDIVVTAQRESQRLLDVPLSVTAISGSQAAALGVTTTTDLQYVTPGLVINKVSNAPQIFLRGIGTPSITPGTEAAVAVYVDGVYISTPFAAIFGLRDVNRLEVIKGPQGTLFGRNSTGGVIQVITRTPGSEPVTDLQFGIDRFEAYLADIYASRPITDNAAASISLHFKDQSKGWGTNLLTGGDVYKSKEYGGRVKVAWTPGDNTVITFSGDYNRIKSDFGIRGRNIPPALSLDRIPVPGFYDSNTNFGPSTDAKQYGISATLVQDIGRNTLTSISSYRYFHNFYILDADQASISVVNFSGPFHSNTFTQELRFSSEQERAFRWTLGAYYIDEKLDVDGTYAGAAFPVGAGFKSRLTTSAISGFAQAYLDVLSSTTLTAGARYTHEEKTIAGSNRSGTTTIITPFQQRVDNKPSWRLAIDHHFTDDIMTYGSFSQSFRSGGYNSFSPGDPAVRPEIVKSFEIGAKLQFWDRRLTIMSAIFENKIENLQVQAVSSVGSVLTLNAAEARSKGADIEVQLKPVDRLRLSAQVSILDGEYTQFPGSPKFTLRPTGGATQSFINAAGNDLIRTPPFTLNVSAGYRIPTSIGDFSADASFYHNDGYYGDSANVLRQPAYDTVNLSLGWKPPSSKFEVTAWIKNLTGTKYYERIEPSAFGFIGGPAEPFNFGLSLAAHL